jgi:hypothetical protein
MENMENEELYMKKAFIFRAVENGWTVSKVGPEQYKFVKQHNGQVEEFTASGFLENFLTQCLSRLGLFN